MDQSEDSDNSSENSFNEMVTVGTGVAYCYWATMQAHPQVSRQLGQPDITGRQWVHNVLQNQHRCYNNFRMLPENFERLHSLLTTWYGLSSTRNIDSREALGLFLWACGTNQCQRQMNERFMRGLSSCSKIFMVVLNAMTGFANDVIRPRDYNYGEVPHELLEYTPFFDGCIGAMDGTHILVSVDDGVRLDHINRYGVTTQNVVAVCDFNMMFTYIGAGTEGSAHDMRVKKKAEEDPAFPIPPDGMATLVVALGVVM